jgi:hypothetical protein
MTGTTWLGTNRLVSKSDRCGEGTLDCGFGNVYDLGATCVLGSP